MGTNRSSTHTPELPGNVDESLDISSANARRPPNRFGTDYEQ